MANVLLLLLCLQDPVAAWVPPAAVRTAMESIRASELLGHVAFLASDELEGRDTPSRGLDVAAAYLASRFRALGLVPLPGADGFFQVKEEDATRTGEHGLVLVVAGPGEERRLVPGRDAFLPEPRGAATLDGIRLVRAGAGGPDDFAETDVAGAAAVIEERKWPAGSATQLLRARERAAARNGAMLLIVEAADDGVLLPQAPGWSAKTRVSSPASSPAASRAGPRIPVLVVRRGCIGADARTLSTVRLPAPEVVRIRNRNVAAMLAGRDARIGSESVLLSAHYDHIGTDAPVDGDAIRNGADDDASGTSAVLAIAGAFAALREPPKRTVAFILFFGEERGMLGSRFYAEHPLLPLDRTVAGFNLEMLGRPEPGRRNVAWITGHRRSTLAEILAEAVGPAGLAIVEDQRYSEPLFGASDNASLVRKGVLAHSISAGHLHADYHRPSDEWEKLDLPHMETVARGIFLAAWRVAECERTPAWIGAGSRLGR